MRVAAIIVAGGSGSRAGGASPKQYQLIGGKPVLWWTLKAFCGHPRINSVRAVIAPEHRQLFDQASAGLDLNDPIDGGASRQESCRNGVESLANDPPTHVLIHDAARPFVSSALIDRILDGLVQNPCVIPGLPVGDTLKRAPGGIIVETIDRSDLWAVQTPQGFSYSLIRDAHRLAAGLGGLTDDASVAERAGHRIMIVPGSPENRKLTTARDIQDADSRLKEGDFAELPDIRVGQGFDVHRLVPGDSITLLGVRIAHAFRLQGHSDADAPMHALTDAILGAIGEGDIGTHFPPSDAQWRGVASRIFLEHARSLVMARGGVIAHIDITILAEAPRVAPHIPAMKQTLGEILRLPTSRISIKATTMETLGFVGRREGLAALASATIRLPAAEPLK